MTQKILVISIALFIYSVPDYGQSPGLMDKVKDTIPVSSPKPDRRMLTFETQIRLTHGFATQSLGFPPFSYSRYISERSYYKAHPAAREPYLSYIPQCDSFFEFRVPGMVAVELGKIKKEFAELEHVKEDSALSIREQVIILEKQVDYYAGFLMTDSPMLGEFNSWRNKIEKLGAWCEDFVKSGAFEARKKNQIEKR